MTTHLLIPTLKGVLTLVFNSASLAVTVYLDYRWRDDAGKRQLERRKVWVWIIRVVNGVFCAGLIVLAVGFGLTSHALALYTTDLSSATPGYLIAACVVAALTA